MQFCTNCFENIIQPCRRIVLKYSVLNEDWHVSQKILYRLIIWKLFCVLIVMDHEWSRSWNFLNKLIGEFLLSIFRSEVLFGHPVSQTCVFHSYTVPLRICHTKACYTLQLSHVLWRSYVFCNALWAYGLPRISATLYLKHSPSPRYANYTYLGLWMKFNTWHIE